MPERWNSQRWIQNADGSYGKRYYDPGADKGPSATKAAAELAAELGVDLSSVSGSGAGGRITKEDVEAASN